MDASNQKISSSIKTADQVEAESAEDRQKRIEEMFKKYGEGADSIVDANNKSSKSSSDTAKELEKAVQDQTKDLEELKKSSEDAYGSINDDIEKQVEKIV